MFAHSIKELHMESSSVCNAECPQCPREDSTLFTKSKHTNLSLDKCKELFNVEFIKNLDKMFMCGNFGDPAASKYTLGIFKYFKKINQDITLGLNSNGGIQNNKWWEQLASILSKDNDYVVFSIDGLIDTNHLYRKKVIWDKVISNASAYINAGGSAHWDMLIFKHNELQVNDAQHLAHVLGFTWFRTKVSKRFNTTHVSGLNPPTNVSLPNVKNPHKIKCHALLNKSIYVSATGNIFPCCWIGVFEFRQDSYMQSLLNSPQWNKLIKSWHNNPHEICTSACGVNNYERTSFEAQWNTDIELTNL